SCRGPCRCRRCQWLAKGAHKPARKPACQRAEPGRSRSTPASTAGSSTACSDGADHCDFVTLICDRFGAAGLAPSGRGCNVAGAEADTRDCVMSVAPAERAIEDVKLDLVDLSPHLATEVKGLDLAKPLDAATVAALRKVWVHRAVLVIRGQKLSQE